VTCPVCEATLADGTPICSCGYNVGTRDPGVAIQRLTREARHGNQIWRRGLVAVITLPVTFMIGSLPTGMMLAMLQLGLAALWIVQGLVRSDVANRKLAAAKKLVQLPAARVVSHIHPKARS